MSKNKGFKIDFPIVDGHQDTLIPAYEKNQKIFDRGNDGDSDIKRLLEGGVSSPIFALNTIKDINEFDIKINSKLKSALILIDYLTSSLENIEIAEIVTEVEQIFKNVKKGKISIILSIEGGEALEGDLNVLHIFYKLGVRCLGLTHVNRNRIADSTNEERTGGGLTNFGAALIKEMDKIGMVIDLAHTSRTGFYDTLSMTKNPVIVSHANVYTLCNNNRNLTDDQIIELANNEGVLGISFCPFFLHEKGQASLDDVLNHIDYIVDLVGIDYVGIGSDYDGLPEGIFPAKGLEESSKFGSLVEGLIGRGYTKEQISKITGGNFIRVFEKIW